MLTVKLIQPGLYAMPWSASSGRKPSVTAPTPKALAASASASVRCLAEAQTELAAKVRNRR